MTPWRNTYVILLCLILRKEMYNKYCLFTTFVSLTSKLFLLKIYEKKKCRNVHPKCQCHWRLCLFFYRNYIKMSAQYQHPNLSPYLVKLACTIVPTFLLPDIFCLIIFFFKSFLTQLICGYR